MSDPIENLVESASGRTIELGITGAVVTATFALYGAASAGRDVYRKAKQIRTNRKDKKTETTEEKHDDHQS